MPYIATFIALLFIIRGLALGIPYVSPQILEKDSGKIESSCCHKAVKK